MKRAVLVAIAGLIAGCTSYSKKLDTWQGQPVASLISAWGPPQSSYTLPDGSQVIQYARNGNMQLPGATYTVPQTTYHQGNASAYGSGGYAHGSYSGTSTTYAQQRGADINIALNCTTQFTISASGYITGYSWNGNNC